jgi:tetratricopeptide (TPR) repeat protein/DNA-binding transcriptional ArsR family regulator
MTKDAPMNAENVNGNKAIWVFTPSRTDPKDLEYILVQRHKLLEDAVERVRESALTAHKHHLLFVGPRGCGKTHLVTLIVNRLTSDDKLADHLRIAWLNEDETCTTLLELLLKIHAALERRYPDQYTKEMLAPAYDRDPRAALTFVSNHLLSSLGNRTLLVAVENLDAIFEELGESGQKELRSLLQENPKLTIVATAQRLVEDLSDRARPFFGFFQIEYLKPLNVDEATELLRNIARLNDKKDVVEFLSTNRGRSRVRALHHLSGGNHRIYIVLSQFITRDSIDALLAPFMKMVDELTPYYQERIRWLPPLQRKIVETLCACETTVPVKEIARRLFSTPQTISSQLQNLREKGYVESNQRGRESLYEVSEPLMRICVEVKENQSHQPLRLLVDFLRIWYDDQELKHRLEGLESTSASCAYLQSAILRNSAEGNLRKKILLEDLQSTFSEKNDKEALQCLDEFMASESVSSETAHLLLVRARLNYKGGEYPKAIQDLTEAINLPGAPAELVAKALIFRGICHGRAGESQRALADLTTVIELPNAPVELVACALVNRGISHGQTGESQREIADYTMVIELPNAPVEMIARALVNRGICYGQSGKNQRAIIDFTTAIELPNVPGALVPIALVSRGMCHGQLGKSQRAIADYTMAIELTDAPVELVARALVNRGMCHSKTGESQREIADYTAAIELPNAPVELVGRAFVNRGICHGQAGKSKRAIADYTAAIGLPNAPVGMVARALVNRGICHVQAGESKPAIADFTTAIELPNAPVEEVAKALICRGFLLFQQAQHESAQLDFETLIGLPAAPADYVVLANFTFVLLYFSEGKWDQGFQVLENALKHGPQLLLPYNDRTRDLVAVIFAAGLSLEGRQDKVSEILNLYDKYHATSALGEAVIQHIALVFLKGEPFPSSDNLEGWISAWEHAAKKVEGFSLSVRLLRTAVNFVKAGGKDPGILLDLTSPERAILEQAFGLAQKETKTG